MKQTLPVEKFGLTELDSHAMRSTDGGSEIGYMLGQVIGYTFVVFRELARGASESAAEMPGLK